MKGPGPDVVVKGRSSNKTKEKMEAFIGRDEPMQSVSYIFEIKEAQSPRAFF